MTVIETDSPLHKKYENPFFFLSLPKNTARPDLSNFSSWETPSQTDESGKPPHIGKTEPVIQFQPIQLDSILSVGGAGLASLCSARCLKLLAAWSGSSGVNLLCLV